MVRKLKIFAYKLTYLRINLFSKIKAILLVYKKSKFTLRETWTVSAMSLLKSHIIARTATIYSFCVVSAVHIIRRCYATKVTRNLSRLHNSSVFRNTII